MPNSDPGGNGFGSVATGVTAGYGDILQHLPDLPMPTFTWGGASADWFVAPSGWVGGGAPGTADTALLQPGTYGVTLSAGETADIGVLLLPQQFVSPFHEGPLNGGQAVTIAAGATLHAAQGTTLGDGTLVLAGALQGGLVVPAIPPVNGLSLPRVYATPTLVLAGGSIAGGMSVGVGITLAMTGGVLRLSGGALDNAGTLAFAGAATIAGASVDSGRGTITAGTLTIAADAVLANAGWLVADGLVNRGTLGGGTVFTTAGLTNDVGGVIAVPAGLWLSVTGGLANTGTVTIGAAGLLDLSASTIDLAAALPFGTLGGAGTLAVAGSLAAGATADLSVLAAGLGGLLVGGTLTGGTILGNSSVTGFAGAVLDGVTAEGTLTLLPGAGGAQSWIRNGLTMHGGFLPITVAGERVVAGGTIAGATIELGSAVLAAETLTLADDVVLASHAAGAVGRITGVFANIGSIDAAASGGMLTVDHLANAGTATVENHSTLALLDLSGPGAVRLAQAGTLSLGSVAAGTVVNFADATTNVMIGYGAMSVAGFTGNNAIEIANLPQPGLGLSYAGDSLGGRLTVTLPGFPSVAGVGFVGDYRNAPFQIEQRGSIAFISLANAGIPVLLAGSTAFYQAQGNDTVVAGAGADTVAVGLRHVIAWGGAGSLTFLNDTGVSTVVAGSGGTSAYGGAGQLTVYGGSGALLAQGGTTGGNLLVGGVGAATLIGGGEGDALFATGGGGNLLIAAPGAETLSTQLATGSNTILASSGGKLIAAGAGADLIVAGTNTTVFGGAGATTIHGGSLVAAGSGDNVIDGAATVYGGTGHSTVYAAPFSGGTNVYVGGSGDQLIVATTGGPNLIYGGSGTQQIVGGQGATTVIGGSGTEIFQASFGAALLLAGTGTDLLVVPKDQGANVLVGGFQPGTDFVQLQGYAAGEAAQAVATQTHAGGATTLLLSDGARITFAGMDTVTAGAFL